MKETNMQINICVPKHWKTDLEQAARILSVKENQTLSYLDLIRRATKEAYGLKEDESTDLIKKLSK